jgi:hypothetical protein
MLLTVHGKLPGINLKDGGIVYNWIRMITNSVLSIPFSN